ncbi:beta-mannosidase [Butyrivibrio sp. YAB3001]|uniref:beta-mannosidase n=1 Tax=Butyrivibrio sp. YAB3001 TaxID=1520812 RepID=UPI0008F68961|nr:glycoside hydrolase family 2 protein [Butyrivibrio sp. YAB3001]SFC90618.1 beta-mannosidase [Butyrivibrio sp. YAB3001]
MIKRNLHDNWEMRRTDQDKWYSAVVPGTVYTDLLENGLMEDPYYRDNEDAARELMDYDYEYRTRFAVSSSDELRSHEEVVLRFEMIDTVADIYLNDSLLGSVCNMHRTYEYQVKEILKDENELRVILHSPNKFIKKAFEEDPVLGTEDCSKGFPKLRKAHYMFGWDWGPRLPDAGIMRTVSLLGISKDRFESVYIRQKHLEDIVALSFDITTEKKSGCTSKVSITSPDGKEIITDKDASEGVNIVSPQLWWPNGYGEQPLYTVKIELKSQDGEVLDIWEKRIGLRTMSISRQKDEYGEEFAHVVNGVKIFAMGADYIPQDNILSRVNKDRTRTLLKHCADSHFNCIRVWGGGYYPEDDFYDICDELGLVVWQDFMFACAVYRLTEDFEENIKEEIIQNVRRLRHHASLGLWCGNNEMELFVGQEHWGAKHTLKSDYVKMYEYLFPKIMKEEDPQTYYWPASPSSGGGFDDPNDENRGDAHYWEVWHGNQPFTAYRQFHFRYLSEFGFQSFPSVKTIETFTEPEDRNIFSYVMEKHQRNSAANGKIMNYMSQTFLYPESLDELVYYSQLLQAEAIRYGVEHFRRNRGRCMGTVYWQLNDCWPVASWASIDYEGRWKALQYYAKRFFAPILISCEEKGYLDQRVSVNDDAEPIRKSIRLNVQNEQLESANVKMKWQLRNARAEILEQHEEDIKVDPLSSYWFEEKSLDHALLHENYVSYQLVNRNNEVISEGTVLFCPPKHFKFVDPQLSYRVEGDEIIVSAKAYAKSVEIMNDNDDLLLSDNYFDLNAEEKRIKVICGKIQGLKLRAVGMKRA